MRATTRDSLLPLLARVFRERGYEGATLTQLSAATGLGKASLYHHFPGGKQEMTEVLVRQAIADAERLAFSHLRGHDAPDARLARFADGFRVYLAQSGNLCLLGVLAIGSAAERHGGQIAAQFRDWHETLTRTLEDAGTKHKRAARTALETVNQLYGAQLTARLLNDPDHLTRTLKRMARKLS
jgi:TetR/AcrR family transcriptional regulator, lmrAB and yxaGH operons repressor